MGTKASDDELDEIPEDQADTGPDQVTERKPSSKRVSAKLTRMDAEVAAGLGKCLRARLEKLDQDISTANEAAKRDSFYSHWAGHLVKIRTEAAKHLSDFEGHSIDPD